MYAARVGFAGQDRVNSLYFGKVFTDPEEKRPPSDPQAKMGVSLL